MLDRGLAELLTDGTLRMRERDHRFQSEPPAVAAVNVSDLVRPYFIPPADLQGFLAYPQAAQGGGTTGLRTRYPALARPGAGLARAA